MLLCIKEKVDIGAFMSIWHYLAICKHAVETMSEFSAGILQPIIWGSEVNSLLTPKLNAV